MVKQNENHMPRFAKLAKKVFGIPATEIGNERVFSVAGVLTALHRKRLGTKKFGQYCILNYNYPKDPLHSAKILQGDDAKVELQCAGSDEEFEVEEVLAGYESDQSPEEYFKGMDIRFDLSGEECTLTLSSQR